MTPYEIEAMKSVLVHGDDEVVVYRHYENVVADLKKTHEVIDLTGTTGYSPRQSLFSELVVYQMKLTSLADLQLFLTYVTHGHLVVGYYDKLFTPTQIKKIDNKKVEVRQFKLSKVIWQFLESLTPNNSEIWLLFEAVKKEGSLEMIFGMVLRQLAHLNLAKFGSLEGVVFGWQKSKLQSQANKFEAKLLKKITSEALSLDVSVKTGILNIDTAITRLLLMIIETQ